jgi:hypothetical protein
LGGTGAVPQDSSSDIHQYFQEYSTTRHDVVDHDVLGFRNVLAEACDERPVQKYLEAHPQLLCSFLRSGHGEWIVPQMRFGSEYVADFVVGCGNSGGIHWHLIELESPTAKSVTKAGLSAKKFHVATRQIGSWRDWLQSNLDYARNPPAANGLGLKDISPRCSATIVIGRRSSVTPAFNAIRKRLHEESHIEVISYDNLLEQFEWICGVVNR